MRSPEEELAEAGMEEIPPANGADSDPWRRAGAAKPLGTFSASTLAGKRAPPRRFHVDGLVPSRNVTLLYGDGGTGKSLLALQLCASTALRTTWLGLPVAGGRSLFVTAEDEKDEIHRRLEDIARSTGCPIEDMRDLHIVSLAGEDAVLGLPGRNNAIAPTALFRSLEMSICEIEPAIVVLDTSADVFGGDENIRAHARQFVGLIRGLALRFGTAVLLLAHPSLSGMSSGSGTSGSTGWNNSVRSRLYLERTRDDKGREHDVDVRVLTSKKSNFTQIGSEIHIRWERGVFVSTQAAAAPSGLTLLAAKEHADQVFLDLLTAYTAEGRGASPNPSSTFAPTVFAKDPRSQGIGSRGLQDAMNRLFVAKRIKVIETGPPARRRQRIALADSEEASQ
jgi:RecA-family ATPase